MDIVERCNKSAGIRSDGDAKTMVDAAAEIDRLRAALKRIADDDVAPDLRSNPAILKGIAWAALAETAPSTSGAYQDFIRGRDSSTHEQKADDK